MFGGEYLLISLMASCDVDIAYLDGACRSLSDSTHDLQNVLRLPAILAPMCLATSVLCPVMLPAPLSARRVQG